MKLIFATNNKNKIKELNILLPQSINIITLDEAGIHEDILELFFTFRENAWAKASYIYNKTGINCIAEDSGICVEALNGEPGVLSARYAGEPTNDKNNNIKLLEKLHSHNNRNAYYQSCICLIWNGSIHYFEGQCHGSILQEPQGDGGFGYDPIFMPKGYEHSFGILSDDIKSKISHRKHATEGLIQFIKDNTSI